MGMFAKLWKKVRGPRREDSVFGTMLFMESGSGYWEGSVVFPPGEAPVEVFVDGAKDDALSVQHDFFASLCKQWPQLSKKLEPLVRAEWNRHRTEFEEPIIADEAFFVASVHIPRSALHEADWQIDFSPQSKDSALIEVTMTGIEPGSVEIDDDN